MSSSLSWKRHRMGVPVPMWGTCRGRPHPTLGGWGGPHPHARWVLPQPAVGWRPRGTPQLTGLFPPVRHAALPQLPASAGAAEPPPLDWPHAPGECHPPPSCSPRARGTPWSPPAPPQRSVSDNALVAMDFSGCTGRVIENPSEVLTVALEEAQAWRVSWGTGVGGGTPPLQAHPNARSLLCTARRRRRTGTASPQPARAPRSAPVSRVVPRGGPCSRWGVPPSLTPISLQPSTAPSPGSMGASPGRTPSSSLAARAWWTGTGRCGGVPGAHGGVQDATRVGGRFAGGDPGELGICSPQEFSSLRLGWGDNKPPRLPEG